MGPGKITVVRLAHVHYFVPDLQKAASFLEDFGLVEVRRDEQRIWYRGFGAQPYVYIAEQSANGQRAFGGAAWVVRSARDMEIAASYPGAIELDLDAPGGGRLVIIKDPNGMAVGLVHGQQLRDTKDGAKPEERIDLRREDNPGYPLNTALEKPRRGKFQRFSLGPSPVHKLGHYGYVVPKSRYQQTVEWYTTCMNLKPTDAVYNPVTGEDETCFMHIDRGMEETDHHSIFIAADPDEKPTRIHHSSFEVNDFDTQLLGHDWLREKGWTNSWGVGRHLLGSQVFDYWFDAAGNIIEHYSDGDLVNQATPFSREPAAPHTLYVWGPNIPLGFLTGKREDAGKDALLPTDNMEERTKIVAPQVAS